MALSGSHETARARKERAEREKHVMLPPGLTNEGNMCFANSTLQALIATRLLFDMLFFKPLPPAARHASYAHAPIASRRSPHFTNGHGVAGAFEKEWVEGMHLGDEFLRVLAGAWHLQEKMARQPMRVMALIQQMSRTHPQYLEYAQQDAHEFMAHLLDTIRIEELEIIRRRQPPEMVRHSNRTNPVRTASNPSNERDPPDSSITLTPDRVPLDTGSTDRDAPMSGDYRHPPPPNENTPASFVDMVFGGRLASILICQECRHVSLRNEDFIDLSLPIRREDFLRDRKRITVKDFAKRLIPTMFAGGAHSRGSLDASSGSPSPQGTKNASQKAEHKERENPGASTKGTEEEEESISNSSDSYAKQQLSRLSSPPSTPASTTQETPTSLTTPPLSAFFANLNLSRSLLSRSYSKSRRRSALSPDEAAYLQKLLADTLPANMFARLKSSDAAQNIWPKSGRLTSIEECLRMFTAVEKLEGEDSVGCRRCWNILNRQSKRSLLDDQDGAAADGESDGEKETGPPPDADRAPIPQPSVLPRNPVSMAHQSSSNLSTAADENEQHSLSASPMTREGNVTPSAVPDAPMVQTMLKGAATSDSQQIPFISTTEPSSPARAEPPSQAEKGLLSPPQNRSSRVGESDEASQSEGSSFGEASDDASSCSTTMHERDSSMGGALRARSDRVIMRPAYKRYLIASAPPILIIHLKRFHQVSKVSKVMPFTLAFNKLDDCVTFPEYMDLGPFMAPRKEDFGMGSGGKDKSKCKTKEEESFKYRLYATVVHLGTMRSGHYVAYVALPSPPSASAAATTSKRPADGPSGDNKMHTKRQWAYVSDRIVRLATLEEVLKANAYICMYERQ